MNTICLGRFQALAPNPHRFDEDKDRLGEIGSVARLSGFALLNKEAGHIFTNLSGPC